MDEAVAAIDRWLDRFDVMIIGPGLGRDELVHETVIQARTCDRRKPAMSPPTHATCRGSTWCWPTHESNHSTNKLAPPLICSPQLSFSLPSSRANRACKRTHNNAQQFPRATQPPMPCAAHTHTQMHSFEHGHPVPICMQVFQRMREKGTPVVIDADGLYIVTKHLDLVRGYSKAILTPNKNEYARLAHALDVDVEQVRGQLPSLRLLVLGADDACGGCLLACSQVADHGVRTAMSP